MVNTIVQLVLMFQWIVTGIFILNKLVQKRNIEPVWVTVFALLFVVWMALRAFA